MKKIIGIYHNPHAGKGGSYKELTELILELERKEIAFSIIPNKSKAITTSWLAENSLSISTFIIIGGDGTINFIVSCLPQLQDISILAIAAGTANIIAHSNHNFNIAICEATNKKGPCIFGASFGFDAAVIKDLATRRKGNISLFNYVMPIIKTLIRFKSHKQKVTIDNKFVGNFDFGIIAQTKIYANSRFYLTKSHSLNTWQAFLIKDLTIYNLFEALLYGLFSSLNKAPCVSCHALTKITINPITKGSPAQVDGETYSSTPLIINSTKTKVKNKGKNIEKYK